MLKLYNLKKEKIEGLTKYKNLTRERDLKKGEDTLSFSYPKKLAKNIKEECYVETKFNFYVIKEIDNSSGDWIGVVAKVNTEGLKSNSFPHFEMVNSYLKDTLNLALAGTGWTIGYSDTTKRRTVRVSNKTSLEVINEIRRAYKTEIFFDAINKKVNVYEKLGEDKGSFFMEDVNLKSLSISSDSYDYATRLIPLGKDGLTIKDVNNGKEYVENYQYSNKIIYATWEDNRYTIVENLKQDAIEKLDELSKPYKSYEADVVDLRGANLGDTITLISKENGVKEKQRVVKITEYPNEPWKNKTEIANKAYTFEEMQNDIIETVDTADTVLTSDGMVDDSKVNFNPIRQEMVHLIAQKVDVVDFNAAVARIGTLEVTKASITDLEVVNARIDELVVGDLTAVNAEIEKLKVGVGLIEHLLAGNITADNIAVGAITAGSGIIAEGAIGDAEISSVTAGKIRAGTLDTSLVTVAGADGKLNITGNRLQVIHEGLERVALGDVNRDGSAYGLRVRGEDGETVLFDERGLTREGLTDGAIDDNKVDDAANIQGHKLDINSVIREINTGDEVIKGTRVQVGDRTLDVELSTQKLAIDDNATEISNQRTQISALDDAIKLKVDNQEFNQYKAVTDEIITNVFTHLSKNTSSIDILQKEIILKVSQSDIDKSINEIEIGGRNLLRASNYSHENEYQTVIKTDEVFKGQPIYKATKKTGGTPPTYLGALDILKGETYTVSIWVFHEQESTNLYSLLSFYKGKHLATKLGEKVGEWERVVTTYTNNTGGDIENVLVYYYPAKGEVTYFTCPKLETGNKATDWTPNPEDFESEITTINSKVAEININLGGITSRVSSAETNITSIDGEVSSLQSRVSTAEQKITPNAIVSTVRESTAYQGDIDKLDLKISTVEQTTANLKISVGQYNDGVLTGATYTFDGNNAIFKGAGFKIQNQAGTDVLKGDTRGNLGMTGVFTSYRGSQKAVEMLGNAVYLYDWEGTSRKEPVGRLYGSRRAGTTIPTITLVHHENAYACISRTSERSALLTPYITFDNDNILGDSKAPVTIDERANFNNGLYIGSRGNRIAMSATKGVAFDVNGSSGAGFQLSSHGGRLIFGYFPETTNRAQFPENTLFGKKVHINGNFVVAGSKNSLQKTEHYGERLLNALETPEYYFQDRGSGKTDKNGECCIYIDDIFDETVNTEMQYHVDIQEYGHGDLKPIKRTLGYFIVEGAPSLEFGWILTAKRKGYEYHRLEEPTNFEGEEETNFDNLIESEKEKQTNKELEKMLEKEMTFDLAEYVLGGE